MRASAGRFWRRRSSTTARAALRPWLRPLIEAGLAGWRARCASLPSEGAPEHGCPEPGAIESVLAAAVRDLVVPGFVRVGLG
ncbi:MAG: hypothetical protein EXR72_23190 [Myxococcales bacterium]|nr:hypothetical protein [Myxococcales bacterium]